MGINGNIIFTGFFIDGAARSPKSYGLRNRVQVDLAQCGEEITCNDHQGAVPDCGEKEEWFRAFGDAEWKDCGRTPGRGIRCRNTTNNQRKVTHCLGMTTLSCRAHLLAMIV